MFGNRILLVSLLLAPLLVLSAGGCGYSSQAPQLPGGANRMALAPVVNMTSQADADVILGQHVRRRLLNHPGVVLVGESRARVMLRVTLKELKAARDTQYISGEGQMRLLSYRAQAVFSLRDIYDSREIFSNEELSASGTEAMDTGTTETPAHRLKAIEAALAALAEQLERRLFNAF
ncbi:MAG: hypothetical protein OEZ59_02375 [Deltaproteobacteria bacterium]|nr:hypothetical protein [Deltaproteobacteria bacterium]